MEIILVFAAFGLLLAGILGAVLPVLPGPPLSFAGLVLLQLSGFAGFTFVFLVTWAIIAIGVTIMDYFLPSLLTKKFGGSKAAIVGSVLGLLAGIFLFPPWGLVFGSFLGAFVGELINSNINGAKALKVALGAFLAFILGS